MISDAGVSILGLMTFISMSKLAGVAVQSKSGTKLTAEAALEATVGSTSSSITEGGELPSASEADVEI